MKKRKVEKRKWASPKKAQGKNTSSSSLQMRKNDIVVGFLKGGKRRRAGEKIGDLKAPLARD